MADGNPDIRQVALTGTEFEADLDGKPVPPYTSVAVDAGAVVTVSKVQSDQNPRPCRKPGRVDSAHQLIEWGSSGVA